MDVLHFTGQLMHMEGMHIDVVEVLLGRGSSIDIDTTTKDNSTALH